MTATRTNAPTLAWLLTALTCLLAGLAVGEHRSQAVSLPVVPPVEADETVEAVMPAPSPADPRYPQAAGAPAPTLLFESEPVRLEAGTARLRVARLTVPPGVEMSAEPVPGPLVLFVESGALAVPGDGVGALELGLDARQLPRLLHSGQQLVLAPGEGYAIHAAGSTPAVVVTLTVVPA